MFATREAGAGARWNDGAAMNDPHAGATSPIDRFARMKSAAPAAAAGLAIVTALVGASLLTSGEQTPALETPAAVSPLATADGSADSGSAVAPAPGGPGSALPGAAFDQTPGATPPAMAMEIVVKFKDDAPVKDIIDAFWRDEGAARARFESFKAGKAEFAGLKLERVTYSNELVLGDANGGGAARLAALREIAAKLSSRPDVAYAEPNMTAQPGAR